MLKRICLLMVIVFSISHVMNAQVTTSSITGTVKDNAGQPLQGATVSAVHTPSGTTYTTIAGREGVFTLPNVRIGGPYSVKITYTGLQAYTHEGFNLELGQPYSINAVLGQNLQSLETVVVTGRGRRAPEKVGASTNIGSRQLATLPTISRSIADFTRITPQSNGSTGFAGRDPRYNNIQIDGANLNNNFGLSNDPLPGGGSNPISLDALDEISVNIAPFDVRQGNFTGAGINAVTRSGDNTYRGSIYGFYRNQSFNGTHTAGSDLPPLVQTSNKTYGARFGGPIIRNKLFFFVNAEQEDRVFPSTSLRPLQPGLTVGQSNVSATPLDSLRKLSDYMRSTYGYETGVYDNLPTFGAKNHKIIGRVDWNISNNHKLTVKYSDFVSTNPNNGVIINGTSMPGGGGAILSTGTSTYSLTRLGNNRFSTNSYGFENSNYGFTDKVRSGTIELNSKVGTKMSNQLIGTLTKIRDTRSFKGSFFPTIDFLNVAPGAALNNQNYMTVGMDPFTPHNDVINDVISGIDNFSYLAGKHSLTAGVSYEYQRVGNQFMPGSNSYYVYRSLNDFITNRPPVYYALTYSLLKGDAAPYASNMKIAQLGLYAQDEYQATQDLKITLGVRADRPIYLEQPGNNEAFAALNFKDRNGNLVNYNTQFPKATVYWSPRVGFRWDAEGNKSLIVRGGTGVFTGRMPFVWLTNISQNNGIIQNTVSVFNTVANPTATNAYLFNPDPNAYVGTFPQSAGTSIPNNSTFAAANPNFKFPQIWRTNFGLDKNLGSGFIATIDAIYSKNINDVYIRNANLIAPNGQLAGTPDTRPRYIGSNKINSAISGNYVLENTKQGESLSFTAQLSKNFTRGFYGSIAYTYTYATSVSDNQSQQAPSLWNTNPNATTANTPGLGYSSYALPHRIVGDVSYRIEYLQKLATTISLYYEGATDGTYSYTYSGDVNGDGNGFDLVYIPRDASEINFVNTTVAGTTYTPAQQWDMLNQFISNDPYLSEHRGSYAKRNGAKLPWYNRIDAKVMQEVFHNIGSRRHTLSFSIDILNVSNLINEDWGAHKFATMRNLLVPNNTFTASGAPQFKLNTSGGVFTSQPFQNSLSTSGTYGFQLGLRYTF
ncbi:MAG: TonB-dependent receptor [Candidatus Dadabacteria bacterium]